MLTRHVDCLVEEVTTKYKLNLTDKCVYELLYQMFNRYKAIGKIIKPGQSYIAMRLGVDRKSVNRSIKKLSTIGLLDITKTTVKGVKQNNIYIVKEPHEIEGSLWYYTDEKGNHKQLTHSFFLDKPLSDEEVVSMIRLT